MQFTIVLPTTGDRAPTLPLVWRCIAAQTCGDFELFVIGDGLSEATRGAIDALARQDGRIRLFDHPKHPRRGEEYRHAALAEAQGRYVAYCCDRDLWLPDHLETLAGLLARADFAHTQYLCVGAGGAIRPGKRFDAGQPRAGAWLSAQAAPLSAVGHRLNAYRSLPFGWRTTPADCFTDRYMWAQFADQPGLALAGSDWPTLMYFARGRHPGWPSARRAAELARWLERLPDAKAMTAWRAGILRQQAHPRRRLVRLWESFRYWHPLRRWLGWLRQR